MKLALLVLTAAPLFAQRYQINERDGLITLRDTAGGMEATVAPDKGAELCGVRTQFKGQWTELLWRACDYTPVQGWTGRAPWLWPAVGRNFPSNVKENEAGSGSSYEYKGKRYPMPVHGFARDLPWRVESKTANGKSARLVVALADSPKTREMYPFGWKITLIYELSNAVLTMNFNVKANEQNKDEMFFSAGNHITFRTPLVAGSNFADMKFQTPSTVEYVKKGFSPTGEKTERNWNTPIKLADFPNLRAITLGGYKPGAWMTLRDPAGLEVRIDHSATRQPDEVCSFNVWGAPKDGYFSPEPWVGLQNSLVSGNGLVKLSPGKEWRWTLRLSVPAQ